MSKKGHFYIKRKKPGHKLIFCEERFGENFWFTYTKFTKKHGKKTG